jgi:arginine decarboxylase
MKIFVTWGTGEGKTEMAAFDSALWDAGIANYNLIKLSSVIPKNADVILKKLDNNQKEHGHKLYVVTAESHQDRIGRKAVAGLGWVKANHTKGRGIFVERGGEDRKKVNNFIRKTIASITSHRPEEHGRIETKFSERVCTKDVACAVVVAVYKSEGWD